MRILILFIGLTTISQYTYASRIHRPLDTIIKYSPIILEGKVVEITKIYPIKTQGGKRFYESFIVEVYKTFKNGDPIDKQYIEIPIIPRQMLRCGNIRLLKKGEIGMFFLKWTPKSNQIKGFDASPHPYDSKIYFPYDNAYSYGSTLFGMSTNIEQTLYQKIEKINNTKRVYVREAPVIDEEVATYLMKNKKNQNQKGLKIGIRFTELDYEEKDYLRVPIVANSINGLSVDIQSLSFRIKYNSKTFGEYVVKNNHIKLIENIRGWKNYQSLYDSNAYELRIIDTDFNEIKVSIQKKDKTNTKLQINYFSVLTILKFKIKNYEHDVQLEILPEHRFINFYNYQYNRIEDAFVFWQKGVNNKMHFYYKSVISKVYPDTIRCNTDDFITIEGKYLMTNEARILIKYGNNYLVLPQKNIIYQSDTMIKFKVDCEMKSGKIMLPAKSGFILGKAHVIVGETYSPFNIKIIH